MGNAGYGVWNFILLLGANWWNMVDSVVTGGGGEGPSRTPPQMTTLNVSKISLEYILKTFLTRPTQKLYHKTMMVMLGQRRRWRSNIKPVLVMRCAATVPVLGIFKIQC